MASALSLGTGSVLRSKAQPDDPDLVRAVQARDSGAISRVLQLCLPALRDLVRSRSGLSAEECEDVLQEVRLAFLEAAPRFRAECSLRTYLVRITCRKRADYLRKRGRLGPELQSLEQTHSVAVYDDALRATLDRLTVNRALEHLSERERLLLDLFYAQGKSYKEIAAEMGIAIGTVARMKSDALAKLRKAV